MTRMADTYVEGYCDGWSAAVQAVTDLVLAGHVAFDRAQARCMDFHRERLIVTRHEDEPPEMERSRLVVLDLPFTDALPSTDADDALAVELGIGDEGEGA
jgi:hypothetical protein